jgi:hypothetical protein
MMPLTMRLSRNRVKEPPKNRTRKLRALPAMVASSTGRRPTRSERAPHTGEKMNCMNEYTEPSSPAKRAPMANSGAWVAWATDCSWAKRVANNPPALSWAM